VNNADRFLASFNDIHRHLRERLHLHEGASFAEAIRKGRSSISPVRWRYDDLNRCRELRNTLVHTRDEDYIAEPTEETVNTIEEIAELLMNPPRVGQLFRKDVFCLHKSEPIGRAVEVVLHESYSQIPIYEDDRFVGLLTTNTIARWLGSCIQEEIVSLQETRIAEVLQYTEDEDNHQFISRRATLFHVLDAFASYERQGTRLEAILITENGKPSETLLGIITIWDLPRIHQDLSV